MDTLTAAFASRERTEGSEPEYPLVEQSRLAPRSGGSAYNRRAVATARQKKLVLRLARKRRVKDRKPRHLREFPVDLRCVILVGSGRDETGEFYFDGSGILISADYALSASHVISGLWRRWESSDPPEGNLKSRFGMMAAGGFDIEVPESLNDRWFIPEAHWWVEEQRSPFSPQSRQGVPSDVAALEVTPASESTGVGILSVSSNQFRAASTRRFRHRPRLSETGFLTNGDSLWRIRDSHSREAYRFSGCRPRNLSGRNEGGAISLPLFLNGSPLRARHERFRNLRQERGPSWCARGRATWI